MERKELINKVMTKIKYLPNEKIEEVNDFAQFLLSRIDDKFIAEGIKKLTSESNSFSFFKRGKRPVLG